MSKKVKKSKYLGMMSGEPAALYSVVSENKKIEDKKLEAEVAKLKPVDIPTTTESVDTATKEAARLEEEKMRKRKGYKSTILTSNTGITQPAPTMKTTLG
jgi:hypothetical protein